MPKVELTTWDRLRLIGIVEQLRGNVGLIRRAGRVLDILALTDEEKEEVGLHQEGPVTTWKDRDRTFQLEMADDELALLKQALPSYDGWRATELSLVDALFERLKIDPGG